MFDHFLPQKSLYFAFMCSLTLNTSQNAVTIVNIQLISKNIIQFNQYLSQKSRFFAENSLFKVFEKILASICSIWNLIPFGS